MEKLKAKLLGECYAYSKHLHFLREFKGCIINEKVVCKKLALCGRHSHLAVPKSLKCKGFPLAFCLLHVTTSGSLSGRVLLGHRFGAASPGLESQLCRLFVTRPEEVI